MRAAWFCVAAIFIFGGWFVSSAAIEEPVHLDSGVVSGVAGSNVAVRVFRGIPYALAPVGKLRWREPQPAATPGQKSGGTGGHAAGTASPAEAEQHRLPPDSITKQTLALPGRTLAFSATAGSDRKSVV